MQLPAVSYWLFIPNSLPIDPQFHFILVTSSCFQRAAFRRRGPRVQRHCGQTDWHTHVQDFKTMTLLIMVSTPRCYKGRGLATQRYYRMSHFNMCIVYAT